MPKVTTRAVAAGAISCLLLLATAPFAGAAKSSETGASTGARLDLLDVSLTKVPVVGNVRVGLGVATGEATTVESPFAKLVLDGIRVGDESVAGHSVSSSDGQQSQDVTVPLSGPGLSGKLTIAKLVAAATKDSATSTLRGLDGRVGFEPLGLETSLGGQGIDSHVDADVARSDIGVDIGPIALQLGDLLPSEVLEALPLSILIDLTRDLDLGVTGRVGEVRALLRDANGIVDDIQTTAAEVVDAQTALDALTAGNPALQTARQQAASANTAVVAASATVTQKNSELAALQTQKAAAEEALAACSTACAPIQAQLDALNAAIAAQQGQVAAAQGALTTAQSQLQGAQAALDAALAGASDAIKAANQLVDQLQGTLDDLLDTLEDLLGQLPDLDALISGVLDALRGAPIVSIGRLQLGTSTIADADKGRGNASCSAQGVKVMGTPLGALSCAELNGQFSELVSGIKDLLSGLPIVGSLPTPTVEGLATKESGRTKPNDEGVTSANASITALQVKVPSVELKATLDQLVADVIAQLTELTSGTPLAPTLDQAIDLVMEQLEALPLGDLLGDLATVGVQAKAGRIGSTAAFASDSPNVLGTVGPPEVLPQTGPGQILMFLALGFWGVVTGAALALGSVLNRRR